MHWAHAEHPVYGLETRRRVQNRTLGLLQLGCVPAIFGTTAVALAGIVGATVLQQLSWASTWYDLESIVPLALGWAIATMMVIQLGAGAMANILVVAQMAPMISGEVELQSWGLLRTTTLSLREIFFAKYAAALTQLRAPLLGLVILRAASTFTIMLFLAYLLLRQTFYYMSQSDWQRFWVRWEWLPPLLAFVVYLMFYVSQPVLQLLLNGAIGMVASAYARTRGQAIAAGLVGRLAAWVTVIITNAAIMFFLGFLITQWTSPSYASLDAYSIMATPSEFEQTWSIWLTITGYGLALLLTQVGLVIMLLGLAMRRARTLGA